MPGITLLIMIVIVVAIVWLFVHDSRRAQQPGTGGTDTPTRPEARPPARPPTAPDPEPPLDSEALEALAGHVRQLRKAVDEGLIGREEAIESIMRQGEGRVGAQAAEQLLDSAEMD